jgi:hypothetical protein
VVSLVLEYLSLFNVLFLREQPYQFGVPNKIFENCIRLHPRELMWWVQSPHIVYTNSGGLANVLLGNLPGEADEYQGKPQNSRSPGLDPN